MKHITSGKIKWWKWLFLLLLALNIAFLGTVALLLTKGDSLSVSQSQSVSKGGIKVGNFSSTKSQLSDTINSYLKDYESKDMSYQVTFDSDKLIFQGSYTLLGVSIPLNVYFQPYRLSNGAVQLKVTSVSAGSLSLPEEDILRYIKSSYDLPKFVDVLPKKSAINVNIQKLGSDTQFYLKATKINLLNDQLSFDIFKKNAEK